MENTDQVPLNTPVDHRPGRVGTGVGEIHFEAGSFAEGARMKVTARGNDGIDVEVTPTPDLAGRVTAYVKKRSSYDKIKGANGDPVTPQVALIDGQEWFFADLPWDEILDSVDTADAQKRASGFVILSN